MIELIKLVNAFRNRKAPTTEKQAKAICDAFPIDEVLRPTGMGDTIDKECADAYIKELNKSFKPFTFRFIFCHDSEYTYIALTYKHPDPRELTEMEKHGHWNTYGEYVRNQNE